LAVVDEDFSKKAENRLLEFVKKSSVLVLASHSQERIKKMCTRILHMDRGSIIGNERI
jgi:lipopolysaccharide transport system ATP-binding protein